MMIGGIVMAVFGGIFLIVGIIMMVNPDDWEAKLQGFPIPVRVGAVLAMLVGIALGVVGGLMAGGVIS